MIHAPSYFLLQPFPTFHFLFWDASATLLRQMLPKVVLLSLLVLIVKQRHPFLPLSEEKILEDLLLLCPLIPCLLLGTYILTSANLGWIVSTLCYQFRFYSTFSLCIIFIGHHYCASSRWLQEWLMIYPSFLVIIMHAILFQSKKKSPLNCALLS